MEVKFRRFSTSALDRGTWTVLRPSRCSMRTDRKTERHELRSFANGLKKSSSHFIQRRRLNASITGMFSMHQIYPKSSLTQSQNMCSALYGNEKFKIAFARAYHWISTWVTWIQSTSWHAVHPPFLTSFHTIILTRFPVTIRNMLYFKNAIMSVPPDPPAGRPPVLRS